MDTYASFSWHSSKGLHFWRKKLASLINISFPKRKLNLSFEVGDWYSLDRLIIKKGNRCTSEGHPILNIWIQSHKQNKTLRFIPIKRFPTNMTLFLNYNYITLRRENDKVYNMHTYPFTLPRTTGYTGYLIINFCFSFFFSLLYNVVIGTEPLTHWKHKYMIQSEPWQNISNHNNS